MAKPAVAAKLRTFAEAAGRWLGYDADDVLKRAEAERAAVPDARGRSREGVGCVARALAAERAGRGAHEGRERARERQREAEQERQGLRRGRGMRM